MLFNSISFVLLVVITFLLYYLPLFNKFQSIILIISSFVFYAYNQPVLLALLITSILINTAASYLTHQSTGIRRKAYAIAGVVLNLTGIAFFKYSPLFGQTFFNPSDSIGEFLMTIPLPIGISFYTFEGISLVVDTFKDKDERKKSHTAIVADSFYKHLLNTTLFVAFFPHLIAGPILKAHEFLPQIKTKFFRDIEWEKSFKLLVVGYFLKMVVADNLKDHTFWITYPYFEGMDTTTLLVVLYGYSIQIFADFAGYSLIALGVAALFGYELKGNFNFPYISKSFKEFWRRWHISLSTFLMEYLYIPLGGNKKGQFRTYLNLMIVMFLGGLWHGAAWSYAVWGTFHGGALAIERFLGNKIKLPNNIFVQILQTLFVFTLVTFAWLLFKLPDFTYAIKYIQAIFTNTGFAISATSYSIIGYSLLYSLPVVLYHLNYLYEQYQPSLVVHRYEFAGYGLMLFLITTNSGSANDFIYFQF